MDRTYHSAAAVSASLILLVVVISSMALYVMRHPSCQEERQQESVKSDRLIMTSTLEREIEEHTNGIAHSFCRMQIIPCASRTLTEVEAMTNTVLRLSVARHLAREVMSINFTNENYHLRDKALCDAIGSIRHTHRCLWIAPVPEMERCEFIFDALQHFMEGAIATLKEPPTKPSEMDRYGRGMRWAQNCCKSAARNELCSAPGYLNNSEFRSAYPKLSSAGQEYFRKRFREVFGIEYVPDEPGRRAYLWGTKGTLWDGKGLEWRF